MPKQLKVTITDVHHFSQGERVTVHNTEPQRRITVMTKDGTESEILIPRTAHVSMGEAQDDELK